MTPVARTDLDTPACGLALARQRSEWSALPRNRNRMSIAIRRRLRPDIQSTRETVALRWDLTTEAGPRQASPYSRSRSDGFRPLPREYG